MIAPWHARLPHRLGCWPIVGVLAIPTVVLFIVFNFYPALVPALQQAGAGVSPLDMQLGYGPGNVETLFKTYGEDGRTRYSQFLKLDLAFAVSYGLLLTGLLSLALRPPGAREGSRWNSLCLVPLLAGTADFGENLCILGLLNAYPTVPVWLAYSASALTLTKWSLACVSILAILIGFIVRVARLAGGNRGKS